MFSINLNKQKFVNDGSFQGAVCVLPWKDGVAILRQQTRESYIAKKNWGSF